MRASISWPLLLKGEESEEEESDEDDSFEEDSFESPQKEPLPALPKVERNRLKFKQRSQLLMGLNEQEDTEKPKQRNTTFFSPFMTQRDSNLSSEPPPRRNYIFFSPSDRSSEPPPVAQEKFQLPKIWGDGTSSIVDSGKGNKMTNLRLKKRKQHFDLRHQRRTAKILAMHKKLMATEVGKLCAANDKNLKHILDNFNLNDWSDIESDHSLSDDTLSDREDSSNFENSSKKSTLSRLSNVFVRRPRPRIAGKSPVRFLIKKVPLPNFDKKKQRWFHDNEATTITVLRVEYPRLHRGDRPIQPSTSRSQRSFRSFRSFRGIAKDEDDDDDASCLSEPLPSDSTSSQWSRRVSADLFSVRIVARIGKRITFNLGPDPALAALLARETFCSQSRRRKFQKYLRDPERVPRAKTLERILDVTFPSEDAAEGFDREFSAFVDALAPAPLDIHGAGIELYVSHMDPADSSDSSSDSEEEAAAKKDAPSPTPPEQQKISLLVEVVGALSLTESIREEIDSQVRVTFGETVLHQTGIVHRRRNPIWTIATNSLFLLTTTLKDLAVAGGLHFEVLGQEKSVGGVLVPPADLLNGKGDRAEYPLTTLGTRARADTHLGTFLLRCRAPSPEDRHFLRDYFMDQSLKFFHFTDSLPTTMPEAAVDEKTRSLVSGYKNHPNVRYNPYGTPQLRVQPGPSPTQRARTKWMTKGEMREEMIRPSLSFLRTGTGTLGTVQMEVLGCRDLIRMDVAPHQKNNTFVCLVFEDVVVFTDVIFDSLNPMWMPWSRRSFAFNIANPSSQLYLGIFHYSKFNGEHRAIGRVSLNIAKMQQNCEYTYHYNIYKTAMLTERKSCGRIQLRARVNWTNQTNTLISVLLPSPPLHVNVHDKKLFKTARFTCSGQHFYSKNKFDVDIIKGYIDELYEHFVVLILIFDYVAEIILWRHIPISIFWFVLTVTFIEKPNKRPSIVCLTLAFTFLAIKYNQVGSASPWKRGRSYLDLMSILFFRRRLGQPLRIAPFEGSKEIRAVDQAFHDRYAALTKRREEQAEAFRRRDEEHAKMLDNFGVDMNTREIDIQTDLQDGGKSVSFFDVKGMGLQFLGPYLFWAQNYLGIVCTFMRFVNNIFLWEECFLAFWVTTVLLVLSGLLWYVPWDVIILWLQRISVLVIMGPHMKLFDLHVVRPLEKRSEKTGLYEVFWEWHAKRAAASYAEHEKLERIQLEEASKLRDMRKYRFGDYIVTVPKMHNFSRVKDDILPESSARPYVAPLQKEVVVMEEGIFSDEEEDMVHIPGHTLVGTMIPVEKIKPKKADKLVSEDESDSDISM